MALQFTTSHLEDSLSLFRYYKKLAEKAMEAGFVPAGRINSAAGTLRFNNNLSLAGGSTVRLKLSSDAGSTKLGDYVVVAGQSGFAGHLEIGNRDPGDNAFYPDDDLMWVDAGDGPYGAHKDGRAYPR